LNSKLLLRIRCSNASTAKKLAGVLSPDNRAIPSDQKFSMATDSRVLTVRVESERLPSAFNTVRSVLRDTALFREIWLISRARSG
jgi:hypothetical protein